MLLPASASSNCKYGARQSLQSMVKKASQRQTAVANFWSVLHSASFTSAVSLTRASPILIGALFAKKEMHRSLHFPPFRLNEDNIDISQSANRLLTFPHNLITTALFLHKLTCCSATYIQKPPSREHDNEKSLVYLMKCDRSVMEYPYNVMTL